MKKKDKEVATTAEGRLMHFVHEMDVFLHPRIAEALTKLVWDVRTEFAQDARNQVFSKELQELQPLLENFRRAMELYQGADRRVLWHMRPIIKKIIELYGYIKLN